MVTYNFQYHDILDYDSEEAKLKINSMGGDHEWVTILDAIIAHPDDDTFFYVNLVSGMNNRAAARFIEQIRSMHNELEEVLSENDRLDNFVIKFPGR